MATWYDWWPVSEHEAKGVFDQLRSAAARFITDLAGLTSIRVLDADRQSVTPAFDQAFAFGDHVRLWTRADSMRQLASEALHAADDTASAQSDALLERFAQFALTELLRRLMDSVGGHAGEAELVKLETLDDPGSKPLHSLQLGEPGNTMVRIQFDRSMFRPKTPRSARRPSAPLVTREHALRNLPLGVSATVGRAALPLEEIASLAPGDVIVLDRPLSMPVELAGGAGTSALAMGFPCRSGNRRAIQLTAAGSE